MDSTTLRASSTLICLALLAALLAGCGDDQEKGEGSAPTAEIAAGTYEGHPVCHGSDRFSNEEPTAEFDSEPAASASFGEGGELTGWTYLFLGDRDTTVESTAVEPGESFGYDAGAHIGKPGHTEVTVLDSESGGEARVEAALDWESPATGYVGSGTYVLRLRATGEDAVEYRAEKMVVKRPSGGKPSGDEPIVRRTEACLGELTRSS